MDPGVWIFVIHSDTLSNLFCLALSNCFATKSNVLFQWIYL
jgi:hypothetical protein